MQELVYDPLNNDATWFLMTKALFYRAVAISELSVSGLNEVVFAEFVRLLRQRLQ